MFAHQKQFFVTFSLTTLLLLTLSSGTLLAQGNSIIISLTIPEYTTSIFDESVFDDFEAQNPGVQVQINNVGMNMYYAPAVGAVDQHLEAAAKYASSADVLYVNTFNLSVEATRAGYFLDLTPLTSIDTTLIPEDFIPAVWDSYQWDGGIWAIPVSASVSLLMYQPAIFDAAGLPYPNASWTMDDLSHAVRELSQTDEDGQVTLPGFLSFGNLGLLMRGFTGQGFYDDNVIPNQPIFSDPDLETLITQWAELEKDGYVGGTNLASVDFNQIPMRIDQSFLLSSLGGNQEATWAGSLLPGGIAGLNVEAFAISSGTQYPEQAYALLKYVSNNIEVVNSFFGDTPARQSLVGIESENDLGVLIERDPEDEILIQDALANAVPVSELRFGEYLTNAVSKINTEGVDALTALQEQETVAIENLQKADAQRNTTVVFVATPQPTAVLGAGDISIKFGMTSFFTPFPNREAWEQAIGDFTASDPQVRQVIFETGLETQLNALTQKHDCFYMPYNLVPSTSNLSTLLSLDPFINADPTFDRSDVIGNTIQQLQKDNRIWGYPLVIQPQVLQYNTEMLQNAGASLPTNGWTIDQFRDALEQLKANGEDHDQAPFVASSFGGTHLLLFIAMYGGIPLDYRVTPVKVNYTEPATVDAIRQVLDLAKEGYIAYSELGNFGFSGASGQDAAITTTSLDASTLFQFGGQDQQTEGVYQLALYPLGNQYNGISYDIGTGYISTNAANPDACYRWLNHISTRPDLFGSMPARRSIINSPDTLSAQGEDVVAIYTQIDELLQNPNTVAFPSALGSAGAIGDLLVQLWLFRAFDSYVLHDGDLVVGLEDAQTFSLAYQGCIASIPPSTLGANATQLDQLNYFRQFTQCAISVDPSLETLLGF
jgi:ABC-type glycerol-3-phosphate transport system substrate-binding protein